MISYVLKNDKYEMKIPALTFGAAGFERNDCDDVYFEFLDKYVELGGWCIDTARVLLRLAGEWSRFQRGRNRQVAQSQKQP